MAVISANVQYNRGEHKLLDYTSLQNSYSTALEWTNDINSNAAIGQYIYISNDWRDEETGKLYPKGPYIVESIKTIDASTKEVLTTGKLTPLSQSIAGEQDLSSVVADLKSDVESIDASVSALESAFSGLPTTFVTDVKDASGNSLVVDGVATLGDYATKSELESAIGGIDFSTLASKEDVSKGLAEKVDSSVYDAKMEQVDASLADVYTKEEVDSAIEGVINQIPEAPFQSVDVNDKVLTLNSGILSSTINLAIDTEADESGKKYIRLTGKNSEDLGKIDIADFVVDGMLESVAEKADDPTTLVFTWNEASGKTTTTEINFGKYVDTYSADGSTLVLGEDNKTFSVKENVFVKTEGYVAYSEAEKTKLASIEENAQVNTIESITLNNKALTVDGDKNINIDLSDYALNASVNESLDLKANVADVYDTSTVDSLLGAKVDSSEYGKKVEEIEGSITTINNEVAKKVDASEGYSLVEDSLINKLGALAEINSVSGNLTLDGGVLSLDLSSYATIADTSANFVQKDGDKGLSTNDFTDELKSKLDNISAGAEVNYVKGVGDNLDVDASGKLTVDLSSKLDANVKVNGASFENGEVTISANDIALGTAITRTGEDGKPQSVYGAELALQSILSDLSYRIDILDPNVSGELGITSIVEGNGVKVETSGGQATISVKASASAGNIADVKTDGIYVAAPEVPDMRSYWENI